MFKNHLSFSVPKPELSKVRASLPYLAIVLGLLISSVSCWYSFKGRQTEIDPPVPEPQSAVSLPDSSEITIYVSGAVKNPGVYTLHSGDRIFQALEKAGGATKQADTLFLHKNLNLATKLQDGDKVYVPSLYETGAGNTISSSADRLEPISVNSANESQLDSITGIGSVTATKIISNRPYTSLQELVEKKVITQSLFNKIVNEISL